MTGTKKCLYSYKNNMKRYKNYTLNKQKREKYGKIYDSPSLISKASGLNHFQKIV